MLRLKASQTRLRIAQSVRQFIDVEKSGARYNLVNSMFDVMITYRLDDLRDDAALHKAEATHAGSGNDDAKARCRSLGTS